MKSPWIVTVVGIVLLASSAPGWGASPKPEATPAAPSAPEHPGMVYIPAGPFLMGSGPNDPDLYDFERAIETPQHEVEVSAFYIDKYEVTNDEYSQYDINHTRDGRSRCPKCPVTVVSWFDARAYCGRQKKRLPTEAEWEKAAKGGETKPPRPLEDYAWFLSNADEVTHEVGQKKPNGYGLYDMLGNVREWTADWFDEGYYAWSERKDPKGPPEGKRRVERGGAFFLFKEGVNPTIRYNHPPHFTLYFLGFRCVQDP